MPPSIISSSNEGVPESEAKQSLFFGSLPSKDITYFQTYDADIDLTTEDAPEDYGLLIDGKYWTARNHIKILDLITEGEVQGIVSGEYSPSGMVEGAVGYSGYKFEPYITSSDTEPFLRSVYLNEVPVVNSNGQFNFQEFEGGYFEGNPIGLLPESGNLKLDSGFLSIGVDDTTERKAQKVRGINERLRGPDRGSSESYYLPKVYRVLNKDLDSVNVNVKIPNLSYYRVNTKTVTRTVTEDGEEIQKGFATDQHGEVVRSEILQIPLATTVNVQFLSRPVYENSVEQAWRDAGSNSIKGLITSPTIWKKNIPVFLTGGQTPSGLIGWDIGVVRATEDSRHSYATNQTFIDSIVELSKSSFSYPNSSLVALNFNAEYFSSIPTRAYDMELQKVQVPVGYDTRTKQHAEVWDGTFQSEKKWTDNPAWIFYDLITNKRYGLGKFARHVTIDKWTLWELSKYCDTMVRDGKGGLEPRFTCNVLINTREDAFKVLKDFASIFRSIIYYGFNNLNITTDKPKNPIYLFTNSNVKDGNFKYVTNALQSLPTVAVVRYNDKTNFYKPSLEYVEDVDAIRKYGITEREVSAFGCTSKSEAVRVGRWILSTENTQTEMVQFTSGPESLLLRPGDVIRVTDKHRASVSGYFEGRIKNKNTIANGWITLDKDLPLTSNTNYYLTINTPTYFYDNSITNVTGSKDATALYSNHTSGISFNSNNTTRDIIGTGISGALYGTRISGNFFTNTYANIPPETTWSVIKNTTTEHSSNLYQITSITESDSYTYSMEALLYNSGKYDFIEKGLRVAAPPSIHSSVAAPPGPQSISASIGSVAGTIGTQQITIKVNPPGSATASDVGTTVGYKIFIKGITNTSACDDSANLDAYDFAEEDLVSGVPKEEFEAGVLFPSVTSNGFAVDGNGDLTITFNYIPDTNKRVYVIRVYAVNSVGIVSANYGKEERCVTQHYPVKDVKIYGLRTTTGNPDDSTQESNVGSSATKALFSKVDAKDFQLIWNKSFLGNDVLPPDVKYRISVFPPGTSNYASATALGSFTTTEDNYAFTFAINSNLTNGPHRHIDVVVEAITLALPYTSSSNSYNASSEGWDVVEILNPRPKDYNLTPRKEVGAIPGNTWSTEAMTTTQYIDSDGAVVLDIRSTSINDLAGGYIYVSKNPFNYKDFGTDGEPLAPLNRPDLKLQPPNGVGSKLNTDEQTALTNWEIIKIPFESPDNDIIPRPLRVFPNTSPAASGIADDFAYNYGNKYYMAVKFYDSFDKAYSKLDPGGFNTNVYPILPLGFARNTVIPTSDGDLNVTNCTYGGGYSVIDHPIEKYDANASCSKKVLAQNYQLSVGTGEGGCSNCVNTGLYLGYHEVNDTYVDATGSGILSVPIYPSRFYSANSENPFKWWVRLNINGQWEGNGIEKIRVLTAKDVWTLYNYNGFFEYRCDFKQVTLSDGTIKINDVDSHSVCKFRMGDKGAAHAYSRVYSVDDANLSAEGSSTYTVTGVKAGVLYPVSSSTVKRVWDHASPGDHIGAFYSSLFEPYNAAAGKFDKYYPYEDRIQSYNERNQAIAGKTRPNLGFRRFRVYFDPHHLPFASDASGLASYSIVGMNSWNGPYEDWKGTSAAQIKESLIFKKAGTDVIPGYIQAWLRPGDVFENIPGLWNHHPAGFGQGYGGLIKTQKYFDVHMGRLVDDSYLTEAFFGVLTTNDYTEEMKSVDLPSIDTANQNTLKGLGGYGGVSDPYPDGFTLNETVYWGESFVTKVENDGVIDYMKNDGHDPT